MKTTHFRPRNRWEPSVWLRDAVEARRADLASMPAGTLALLVPGGQPNEYSCNRCGRDLVPAQEPLTSLLVPLTGGRLLLVELCEDCASRECGGEDQRQVVE